MRVTYVVEAGHVRRLTQLMNVAICSISRGRLLAHPLSVTMICHILGSTAMPPVAWGATNAIRSPSKV